MSNIAFIPLSSIERLPIYLTAIRGSSKRVIQSSEIAALVDCHSAQIRKDFTYFGTFGVKGTGYVVESLKRDLETLISLPEIRTAITNGIARRKLEIDAMERGSK